MKSGAIIQICFSVAAITIFFSLWIYLLSYANCYRDAFWEFNMKVISVAGAICGLFVLFHSCFEHKVSSRGVFGCVIFFTIAIVTFANILVAFLAMNCVCRCYPGSNAWAERQPEDLVIFGLSLAGSLCLIIIILVASVAHE